MAIPVALVLIGVLLALPGPDRRPHTVPATSPTSAGPGPPLLATVWPHAHPMPVPRLADGSVVRPMLATSTTTIGVVDSPDLTRAALVSVDAQGRQQVLQTTVGGLFQGVTLVGDRLFWMLTARGSGTGATVGLWSAPVTGGAPSIVTTDVGQPMLLGAGYGIGAHTGRLYWTSLPAVDESGGPPTGPTQLRSIALSGGPVQVHTIGGVWAMTVWPWLVTVPDIAPAPGRYNLDHASTEPVAQPAGYRQVACGPVWCLASGDAGVELLHPDGTDARPAGVAGTRLVTDAVTAGDRYVPLLEPVAATQRLVLYDLQARKPVLVAAAIGDASTDGRYLWWSTGDHETVTWYGLDLSGLR